MLLITGFGPFPLTPNNPSGALAQRLARQRLWSRIGARATSLVMPTSYGSLDGLLMPEIHRLRPDAVLMLGVAARTPYIRVEMQALNRASILFPDANGVYPEPALIRTAGLRRSNSRRGQMALSVLRKTGIAVRASSNARRYLCNAAYFRALAEPALADVPVIFVHVPLPRERKPIKNGTRSDRRRPSMYEMQQALLVLARDLALAGRRATSASAT